MNRGKETDPFEGFTIEDLDSLYKSGRTREVLIDSQPGNEPVNKEDLKFLKNQQKHFIELMMSKLPQEDIRKSAKLLADGFRSFTNLFKSQLLPSQKYLEDEMNLENLTGCAESEFKRWQNAAGGEQMFTPEHREAQKNAQFWQRAEDIIREAWEQERKNV